VALCEQLLRADKMMGIVNREVLMPVNQQLATELDEPVSVAFV
jgi:hypothetical protein